MSDQPNVVDAVQRRGFFGGGDPKEMAPRTLHVPTMAGYSTRSDGRRDSYGRLRCRAGRSVIHEQIHEYTDAPLHTVIYTHGHVDHCMGLAPWLERAPVVVAHENVDGFDRYLRTLGLQEHINRSSSASRTSVAGRLRLPATRTTTAHANIGGERFELHHGKGETDDATWVWAPDRGILAPGDFWISCVPNCGNPQKVQRYPEEWVDALEQMIPLGADLLLPGHGPAIEGAEK